MSNLKKCLIHFTIIAHQYGKIKIQEEYSYEKLYNYR